MAEKDVVEKQGVADKNVGELAPGSMLQWLYERRKALEPGYRDDRIPDLKGGAERIVDH